MAECAVLFTAPSRSSGSSLGVTEELISGERCLCLRFFNSAGESVLMQSCRRLDHADSFLVLPYHRGMLACLGAVSRLVLQQQDFTVAVLGLGGGALVTALDQELPAAAVVHAIELDPGVVYLAGKFFGFVPSQRVKVATAEGLQWLRRHAGAYDVIFVDIDAAEGSQLAAPAAEFCSDEALAVQRAACKPAGGLCIVNVLADPDSSAAAAAEALEELKQRCAAQFDTAAEAVFSTTTGDFGNRLLLLECGTTVRRPLRSAALMTAMRGSFGHRQDIQTLLSMTLESFTHAQCAG
jgi:spermidine synthase